MVVQRENQKVGKTDETLADWLETQTAALMAVRMAATWVVSLVVSWVV